MLDLLPSALFHCWNICKPLLWMLAFLILVHSLHCHSCWMSLYLLLLYNGWQKVRSNFCFQSFPGSHPNTFHLKKASFSFSVSSSREAERHSLCVSKMPRLTLILVVWHFTIFHYKESISCTYYRYVRLLSAQTNGTYSIHKWTDKYVVQYIHYIVQFSFDWWKTLGFTTRCFKFVFVRHKCGLLFPSELMNTYIQTRAPVYTELA